MERELLNSALISKLALVTTSPYQVALFFEQQLAALPSHIKPIVYSNEHDRYASLAEFDISHVPIQRSSRLSRNDMRAIADLRRRIRGDGVSTVVTMSPKAGLVGQLAALSAGTQNRLHIFTGQVWQGLENGPHRSIVRSADVAIGRLATHLAADSPSQAEFLRAERIAPRSKTVDVPHAKGSIRGVDIDRFRPNPIARSAIRSKFKIAEGDTAFIQLGRIALAKGVVELVGAFRGIRDHWRTFGGSEPRLFIVGEDEEGLRAGLATVDGVEVLGFTKHPEDLLAAMDVMVLASHREGFGSSIVEGAAVGLPAVGTDIVGVRDAIVDGETGWLVPRRSEQDLERCLLKVLQDPLDVVTRGRAARRRALDDFESTVVLNAWTQYLVQIHSNGSVRKR